MAMRVDQSRQQRPLAQIDDLLAAGGVFVFLLFLGLWSARPIKLGKFSDLDNPISIDPNGAVVDRRTIHRDNRACPENHSLFTALRHSFTSRLHASWQSNGIAAS